MKKITSFALKSLMEHTADSNPVERQCFRVTCMQEPSMLGVNFSEIISTFFRIYYQTSKDIYPGQELLVDYGDIYAKSLGLFEELELSDVSKTYFCQILNAKLN